MRQGGAHPSPLPPVPGEVVPRATPGRPGRPRTAGYLRAPPPPAAPRQGLKGAGTGAHPAAPRQPPGRAAALRAPGLAAREATRGDGTGTPPARPPAVPAPPGRQGAARRFPSARGWQSRGSSSPRRRRLLLGLRRSYCACARYQCLGGAGLRRTRSRTLRMRAGRSAAAVRGGGGGPAASHERVRGCGAAFGPLGYGGGPERQRRQPGEDRHVPRWGERLGPAALGERVEGRGLNQASGPGGDGTNQRALPGATNGACGEAACAKAGGGRGGQDPTTAPSRRGDARQPRGLWARVGGRRGPAGAPEALGPAGTVWLGRSGAQRGASHLFQPGVRSTPKTWALCAFGTSQARGARALCWVALGECPRVLNGRAGLGRLQLNRPCLFFCSQAWKSLMASLLCNPSAIL